MDDEARQEVALEIAARSAAHCAALFYRLRGPAKIVAIKVPPVLARFEQVLDGFDLINSILQIETIPAILKVETVPEVADLVEAMKELNEAIAWTEGEREALAHALAEK